VFRNPVSRVRDKTATICLPLKQFEAVRNQMIEDWRVYARADQTGVRAARARSLQTVTVGARETVAGRSKGTNPLDTGFRVTCGLALAPTVLDLTASFAF